MLVRTIGTLECPIFILDLASDPALSPISSTLSASQGIEKEKEKEHEKEREVKARSPGSESSGLDVFRSDPRFGLQLRSRHAHRQVG